MQYFARFFGKILKRTFSKFKAVIYGNDKIFSKYFPKDLCRTSNVKQYTNVWYYPFSWQAAGLGFFTQKYF